MTKIGFLMCLLIVMFLQTTNVIGQDFEEFIMLFPERTLPFEIDNSGHDTLKVLPSCFAYKYLCDSDSSLLSYDLIGKNQETMEVIYRTSKPFKYRVFGRFEIGEYDLLLYDGYTADGQHVYTTIVNVGLFDRKGRMLDELPFFVFDETGKLEEISGTVIKDNELCIQSKEYKDKSSFYLTKTTYEVDLVSGKFVNVGKNRELVNTQGAE